jgi:hypothetical protein
MCNIDDAERVFILQESTRKARRAHKCDECRRDIEVGEAYQYEFGKLDSDAVAYRTCRHCLVGRAWLSTNCGGWVYGSVIEEIAEHADQYPALAGPLREIEAKAKSKWRMPNGDLMPVCALPPPITVHA